MPSFSPPNTSYDDIIATTIEDRSGELADNVTKNIALLAYLEKRGRKRMFSGGNSMLEEISYAENGTVGWYSGYETLNVAPQQTFSAARFDIRQLSGTFTMSGLDGIMNDGKAAIIDLASGRFDNLKASLRNTMATGIYSDGTGSGGRQILGLQTLVNTTNNSGTIGGIDASAYTWWQNYAYSAGTDGGAAVNSANIERYMNKVYFSLVRNNDSPNLIVADTNYFTAYYESLQAHARIAMPGNADEGDIGFRFKAITYQGVPVIMDGGKGGACPTNTMYFLNTDYISFRPVKGREFTRLPGERRPINQDAMVVIVAWAGNMTLRGRQYQGVLYA